MFDVLIQKRRSIRRYSEKEVENEKIDVLVEAALRSPSSRGFNPWKFIVVTDKDLLEKLALAKPHGSSFLKDAQLGFVVCADPEISDVWVEDTAIATIFVQLSAESLGLGSCWIQIRKRMHNETKSAETYISEMLNIPDNLKVESMIAIGYPDEIKLPHKKADLHYEKMYHDTYGNSYRSEN
ncbi:nitroreductase family protein [Thermodesulfobacteriota bacterium]